MDRAEALWTELGKPEWKLHIIAAALRQAADEMRQASIDACDDAIGALQGDREVEAALECIKRIRALASPAAAPAADQPAEPVAPAPDLLKECHAFLMALREWPPLATSALRHEVDAILIRFAARRAALADGGESPR